MYTGSDESSDRLRQAIDDEIISLEQSIRVLKSRRNAHALISRLPPETLAAIFSFLSTAANDLKWICVSHVCRQWRETALNYPHLWSHINLSKPAPAAIAEILARAKMACLHFEADFTNWRHEHIDAFEKLLEAHISRTRHLKICGPFRPTLERLISSAPNLESLSLLNKPGLSTQWHLITRIILFGCIMPSLTSLELEYFDISWKSGLLKSLQALEIRWPSEDARPELDDWLDALDEMPQIKMLVLLYATPLVPLTASLTPEPSRTVTLPSLTTFYISASAKDCALALAHLVLPALTRLHVDAESRDIEGGDVQLLIPYVARNVYVLQDTEPLRSILIDCKGVRAEVVAPTMPDTDLKFFDPNVLAQVSVPVRFAFSATGSNWNFGMDTTIMDAFLTLIPVNSISTLVTRNNIGFSKKFWFSHAPRWPLLERASLVPSTVNAFIDVLTEDAPPDGPRLPRLTELKLVEVKMTDLATWSLRKMLVQRVEQGVPLHVLDLSMSIAVDGEIDSLREITPAVDVKEPQVAWRNRALR